MNLSEAKELLHKHGFILESEEWTDYERKQYGTHIDTNVKAYIKSGRDKLITYTDDERYNDHEGLRWLNTKKSDEKTLWLAYIDGVLDTMSTSNKNYESLLAAYKKGDIETAKKYIDIENAELTINFLLKHRHGRVTVYRGVVAKREQLPKNCNTTKAREQILNLLSNKTKRFNSFSVDPEVSRHFLQNSCTGWITGMMIIHKTKIPVLISAEVEPNDINFAFTAYLGGRHKNYNYESELNISNLRDLKNFKIIYYDWDNEEKGIDFIKNNHAKGLSTALFKLNNNNAKLADAFDNVSKIDDNCWFVCANGTYNLIKRDGKKYKYVLDKNFTTGIPVPQFHLAIFYNTFEKTCELYNSKGEPLTNNKFSSIEKFNSRGYAKVSKRINATRYINIINTDGEEIIKDEEFAERLGGTFGSNYFEFLNEPGGPIAVCHLRDKSHMEEGEDGKYREVSPPNSYFIYPNGDVELSDEAEEMYQKFLAAYTAAENAKNAKKQENQNNNQ